MFKISKYVDSDKESIDVFPIELEINGKSSKTLGMEINGYLEDDDYTFRFIFSDIEKVFNINVDEEVCLDESYLLEGETMFTYNGVTDLETMCDIDIYRINSEEFKINITFNSSEYNGIISLDCNLKKYL